MADKTPDKPFGSWEDFRASIASDVNAKLEKHNYHFHLEERMPIKFNRGKNNKGQQHEEHDMP